MDLMEKQIGSVHLQLEHAWSTSTYALDVAMQSTCRRPELNRTALEDSPLTPKQAKHLSIARCYTNSGTTGRMAHPNIIPKRDKNKCIFPGIVCVVLFARIYLRSWFFYIVIQMKFCVCAGQTVRACKLRCFRFCIAKRRNRVCGPITHAEKQSFFIE